MSLSVGLRGTATWVVREEDTAIVQGSGTVPVLATPRLLALMEAAAVAAVAGALPPEATTIGVKAEIEHLAPTPVGMEVTAVAELVEVEGRRLVFRVEARDQVEVIGRGRHERVLVDVAKFLAKAQAKRSG
ncbi:thioesterase superfamily protein [Ammonifex degensii KC4]|uniref:Thioesterase superfamily protein n=1 Tax=Ammonifex degensii (strain DSM 10501 / KC4) TaxID=429009 RepID=C9R9F2_AMMDK|nr:hotdog domain-containing protein [Ammonifex degensii]ACX52931.1 thioesterase superfamily protein [Ammonifex degensii KC4]